MSEATINVIKVFVIGVSSFALAISLTPFFSAFLYKKKLWKKKTKERGIDGKSVAYFQKFHSEQEKKTPRIGGMLIWVSVIFLTFFIHTLAVFFDFQWIRKLDFLSRDQTWLPIFTLFSASLVGLLDDLLQVLDSIKAKYIEKGLSLRYRIMLVGAIATVGAWWFYFRLGYDAIYIPFFGDLYMGALYFPFFIIVMIAIYSGGVIDGIDGLSGGVFASILTAYTAIALFQGQINLAAFCLALVGSILAFLWFNIPPARFYMGETGVIGLTATITVVAFLTGGVFVLPIIAILLVATSASVIIQLLSKKFLKRKVFLAAPLHHHYEALGWPHYKVTMRFWIIGVVFAIIGVVIHFLG
jgi:phospho-N-acetylmuramoyl-pentapeptide-transferase